MKDLNGYLVNLELKERETFANSFNFYLVQLKSKENQVEKSKENHLETTFQFRLIQIIKYCCSEPVS